MSQLLTENQNAPMATLTSHAMLVPWGFFAQRIGLVETLEAVPIAQRRREYTPQTKLIEFLVSILAGCAYLQDISRGPHPLDQDSAVAQAWGQEGWADYSGVSRTLKACTEEAVAAVEEALEVISRPFIEREVMQALLDREVLVYDGDLTGRPVSSTSTTYPGAAFGWMSDAVQLGYQAALVSLHSPTYGRLWLSVEQHPGDAVSSSQAEALVRAAEARTGARPWRRTDLLAERITQQMVLLQEAEAKQAHAQVRLEEARHRLAQVEQERQMWSQKVAESEARYRARNRPGRPHSRLAQARRKLAVRERRLGRRQKDLERAQRWLERCQQKVADLQADLEQLQQRLVQFIEDNRTNPWPIRAIFRLDGGFGNGPNVALLIEMGYEVYSKATNGKTTQALRRQVTPAAPWARVGKNAEMTAWEGETITHCPYPLDVALERFQTGDKERHGVLLHYGEERVTSDLGGWFTFYNGRQTIEAGVKEGKNVFQMHHLKVRSAAGLVIQEEFAAFAANFVRWAAAWLHEICPDAPAPFDRPQASVKQMVRVAANTSAWVIWQPQGCLLRFTELSAFAGVQLVIQDSASFQLALPLFKSCVFSPI
ncbi:MAG: hypothetical protein WBW48_12530 [Anaerolineae bacterium]